MMSSVCLIQRNPGTNVNCVCINDIKEVGVGRNNAYFIDSSHFESSRVNLLEKCMETRFCGCGIELKPSVGWNSFDWIYSLSFPFDDETNYDFPPYMEWYSLLNLQSEFIRVGPSCLLHRSFICHNTTIYWFRQLVFISQWNPLSEYTYASGLLWLPPYPRWPPKIQNARRINQYAILWDSPLS